MTSRIAIHGVLVALACTMANTTSHAQGLAEFLQIDANASAPTDAAAATIPEVDWSLLDIDAGTLMQRAVMPSQRAKQATGTSTLTWTGRDKSDGAAAVSVKQPLSPFWDTLAGADMNVVPVSAAAPLPNAVAPQSSGTAWVAMTAPGVGSVWDKTAIEARVDPAQAQTKLGTSLSKSVPLDGEMALTLQNGTSVVQHGLAQVTGLSARPARNFETDQSAKLSLTDTGTSLIAAQSLSSTDDKWLRKVGAEQKLFGEVSVAGTVSETSTGTLNRTVTAGFKHSW